MSYYSGSSLARTSINRVKLPLALDAITSTSGSHGSGTSDETLSVTIASNSNRILVVGVTQQGDASQVINSVKLGAVAFTKAVSVAPDGFQLGTEIWYLVAPATGSGTVNVNMTGTSVFFTIGSYSFFNGSQSTPVGVTSTNGNDPGTGFPSIDITPTTTGSWILDTHSLLSAAAPVASQTQGWNLEPTSTVFGVSQRDESPTISSANTLNWTGASAARFNSCAVEIITV